MNLYNFLLLSTTKYLNTLTSYHTLLAATPSSDEFNKADRYNIPLDEAVNLWTASVRANDNADQKSGMPFMDSKSKDYFVDDLFDMAVSRSDGIGMELLEIAGGRQDGFGITIISSVTEGGNAEKSGIIPGDSISAVKYRKLSTDINGVTEEVKFRECECRDFDTTIDALVNFPEDSVKTLYLDIKRIRRWPKIQVQVEYPPSQCAEGVSNIRNIELFAGENLKRALVNRGIVLDDPTNTKCDYCGSNACYVSILQGQSLLNPIGITEANILRRNPRCRLSCKTTVGYKMQEGVLGLRVNLSQWDKSQ